MFGALVLSGNFACKKKKAIETEYVLFNQITQHKGFCSPGWKFAREDDSNVAFAGLINNKIGKGGVKCNASFKKGNINPKFLSWHKCSFTTFLHNHWKFKIICKFKSQYSLTWLTHQKTLIFLKLSMFLYATLVFKTK